MTTISQVVEVVSVTASRFNKPQTSHLEKAAYLVGTPIAHSQSPGLHHAIYSSMGKNWGQVLAETDDLPGFIDYLRHDERSMGSGVTMPYKVAVIPYLDELTEEGKAVGAINTIFYKLTPDGKRRFIGTNTDVIGIRDAFLNNAVRQQYTNKPGLVVGGGGTCRAAIYALRDMLGCSPIYVVNRDKSEVDAVINEFQNRNASQGLIHVLSEQQAHSLPSPAAIVSAVPDFEPVTDGEKLARAILSGFLERGEAKSPLLEMCYHPSPNTEISRLASQANWQVIGGIEAMIGQGIAQASLWTGVQPDQEMRDQIRHKVRENLARTAS